MYVKVRDSAVPARETKASVTRDATGIVFTLQDANVEAIGLDVFLTDIEAHEFAASVLILVLGKDGVTQ